ncbi:MAG: hypothetical protein QM503_05960 [Bacteroidota bacterium]
MALNKIKTPSEKYRSSRLLGVLLILCIIIIGSACSSNKNMYHQKKRKKKDCDCSEWSYNRISVTNYYMV